MFGSYKHHSKAPTNQQPTTYEKAQSKWEGRGERETENLNKRNRIQGRKQKEEEEEKKPTWVMEGKETRSRKYADNERKEGKW